MTLIQRVAQRWHLFWAVRHAIYFEQVFDKAQSIELAQRARRCADHHWAIAAEIRMAKGQG